jgi:hypothetical protein
MNTPQQQSDRQRLQELLAVPERDRTDEQWDEINQLEISLAPGNRDNGNRRPPSGYPNPAGTPNPVGAQQHARPGGGGGHPPGNRPHGQKQGKKFHRPKRPGGQGGQGGPQQQ